MEVGLFFSGLQPCDGVPGFFSGLPGRFSAGNISKRCKVYGIGCKGKIKEPKGLKVKE